MMSPETIVNYVCPSCGARWNNVRDDRIACHCGRSEGQAVYSTRTQVHFGGVRVIGPHNRTSNKWTIDLVHSSLALYWAKDPDRAREELAELRAALDFIERQVLP